MIFPLDECRTQGGISAVSRTGGLLQIDEIRRNLCNVSIWTRGNMDFPWHGIIGTSV